MEREKITETQQDLVDLIILDGNILFVPEGLDIDILQVIQKSIDEINKNKNKRGKKP